jgi:hypothetical protein
VLVLRAARRRRFCGLVRAHCWRAATARHFPEVAAAMLAAAAACAGGGGPGQYASASASFSGAPSAAEWQAAYKLLTLVPWTIGDAGVAVDKLAPMRACVPSQPDASSVRAASCTRSNLLRLPPPSFFARSALLALFPPPCIAVSAPPSRLRALPGIWPFDVRAHDDEEEEAPPPSDDDADKHKPQTFWRVSLARWRGRVRARSAR